MPFLAYQLDAGVDLVGDGGFDLGGRRDDPDATGALEFGHLETRRFREVVDRGCQLRVGCNATMSETVRRRRETGAWGALADPSVMYASNRLRCSRTNGVGGRFAATDTNILPMGSAQPFWLMPA